MLSPKTQTNLKNAKSYFEEHLAVGDYYAESGQVAGEWIGKGAEMLGLAGVVGQSEFVALCDNTHPRTGALLTRRLNHTRTVNGGTEDEHQVADRRVFYDFTFSPPKSVSIAALVGGDAHIVAAHREAVRIAVCELEAFAATRVRTAGSSSDRTTGNIVAALFQHDTSRALDPHLHTHCIIFNATHDADERHWKALQNYQMLVAQKYVENVYYHELARELRGAVTRSRTLRAVIFASWKSPPNSVSVFQNATAKLMSRRGTTRNLSAGTANIFACPFLVPLVVYDQN
jgi:conjugative relaxase-like TrwC/TraI family protein